MLNSPWLPRLLRLNIIKTTMWQAFLRSSSVWTTVKTQRETKLRAGAREWWRMLSPGMELGQWWRLWHRTGHRWIEKCNMNVLVAIRDRVLSWAGHVARMDYKEICAKALRCRGLQWWRWRQLNWKEVEREEWSGPHPQRFKIYRWEDIGCWGGLQICWKRGWSVENCPRQHGLVAFCSKPWKLEAIFEMWKEPCIDGPGCLGDPRASGMTGTIAVVAWMIERRIVRERLGEHLLPLSRHHTHCDIAMMLSRYNTGYGWLGSYGSLSERRRGSWDGKSEVRSDVDGPDNRAERKCLDGMWLEMFSCR